MSNRSFLSTLCTIVAATLLATTTCVGQPPGSSAGPDDAAIRASAAAFVKAFNEGNAEAVAALWTDDGVYVDELGQSFAGREAIQAEYAQFFKQNSGAQIRVVVDSVRLLSENAAIEDGRTILEPAPPGALGGMRYTAVHVKVGGKWKMASVRDQRIETPANAAPLADLAWLIGTWVAEDHGVRTESVFSWVGGENFLQKKYTITRHDGASTNGLQVIGWNPELGRLQSWDFSPDGGLAVGLWSPSSDGWISETSGVTGDGAVTTSVNRLTRLDDNGCVWQSAQRSINGMPLPDTDEVVLKRQ